MATRALHSAGKFLLGCPRPLGTPAAPPPPPAPAAESVAISMTDDGTLWLGYARYGGLEVTSQSVSGTVTVYGGPDTTWPIIHQVASPTVGVEYLATGVDIDDVDTYIQAPTLYVVHAGTTQTVEYTLYDDEVI
jgi:hypothetical protein